MTTPDDPAGAWGDRLRTWRADTMHWSQQDLVDQVVRLAFERNEERGTRLETRLVSRWESGAVTRPQAVYRRLLDQLGAPLPGPTRATSVRTRAVLPGPCPPSEPDIDLPSRADHINVGATEGDDESVLRRDFLRAGSVLAASGLLASVLGPSGSDSSCPEIVAELEERLVSLRKLDNHLGGADTYRLYAAEAELSAQLLRQGSNRQEVERRLLALHAEQSQQAGWAAFDAGWHDHATRHFAQGHAAATEIRDAGLAGNALAFEAYQRITLGQPARLASERSLHAAGLPGVDPGVQALLYSRAAWTFALEGDAETTARSLGLAEEALGQTGSEPTPDYAAWVDETELAIMSGRCWSELQRPLRAVPILEGALSKFSDANARDKALYSSWLAESYLDAGEVEQAAGVVDASLTIMGDVASVRPRARLSTVARRLSKYQNLAVVRDLLGRDALDPGPVRG